MISNSAVRAQSGYTLVDSCIEIHDSWDTTYTRSLLVVTDTGRYTIYQSMNPPDPWITINYVQTHLYNFYNVYDSMNRLYQTCYLIDSTGQWQYYMRSIYIYDSLNRISDSIQQSYSGNMWIDSLKWSWLKDTADRYIFNQSQYFGGGTWINNERKEWYYDNLYRDTLELTFDGNGNQWLLSAEQHTEFSSNGMIDFYQIGYSSGIPFNIYKEEHFYQGVNEDSLILIYNGNGNQWDSSKMIRKNFNSTGDAIFEWLLIYSSSAWINWYRTFYSYDTLHRVIIRLVEESDTIGNWNAFSRDSTYYDTIGNVNISYFVWNGSEWLCSDFNNTEYFSAYSYHQITGMLDNVNCSISGYYSDEVIYHDDKGRVTYRTYDGHAGSSWGYSSYGYDSLGFLHTEDGFGSTMGGITNEHHCTHYLPLVFSFEPYKNLVCEGDSISLTTHPFGGAYNYNYIWTFNNQLLVDSTSILINSPSYTSGWYKLKISDMVGNYYADSVYIEIHPSPILINDTIVCINTQLTLNPGLFTSYLWNDGSTNQSLFVTNSFADTTIYWVMVSDTFGCSNTDSVMIIYDPCLGIIDETDSDLNIYPNPTTEFFVLEWLGEIPIRSISIYDAIGKKFSTDALQINSNTMKVDISHFPSQTYFIEVITDSKNIKRKIIKN